jgi:hypothetical protein
VTQRLERKLLADVARASSDFRLLEPGDRVLVAVSGGPSGTLRLSTIWQCSGLCCALVALRLNQTST